MQHVNGWFLKYGHLVTIVICLVISGECEVFKADRPWLTPIGAAALYVIGKLGTPPKGKNDDP